jgi:hypothetical protein
VKKLILSLNLDIGTITQIAVAIANFVMAFVMLLSIREIRKDRRRSYLEKRLEEFYIPLINLFSNASLNRGVQEYIEVERIIVSKRYLCGRKVAAILPQHFEAALTSGSFYFHFSDEEKLRRWVKVADTVWEEYLEVLKEYYRVTGVKYYMLPEKPKWIFKAGYP